MTMSTPSGMIDWDVAVETAQSNAESGGLKRSSADEY